MLLASTKPPPALLVWSGVLPTATRKRPVTQTKSVGTIQVDWRNGIAMTWSNTSPGVTSIFSTFEITESDRCPGSTAVEVWDMTLELPGNLKTAVEFG